MPTLWEGTPDFTLASPCDPRRRRLHPCFPLHAAHPLVSLHMSVGIRHAGLTTDHVVSRLQQRRKTHQVIKSTLPYACAGVPQ
jgi:hypothetical protein